MDIFSLTKIATETLAMSLLSHKVAYITQLTHLCHRYLTMKLRELKKLIYTGQSLSSKKLIYTGQPSQYLRTNGPVNAHLRSAVYTNVIENSPSIGAGEALGPLFFQNNQYTAHFLQDFPFK